MKNKRVIFGVILCFVMLLTLTGCGNKTAITKDEFIGKAKNHNYVVIDATSQYTSYEFIESVVAAKGSNEWQIEFYVLSNESEAIRMFNINKEKFESYKGNSSSESSSNIGNYAIYSLTSGGSYMYVCRVDNTLLYARVNEKYKNVVKKFANELGY